MIYFLKIHCLGHNYSTFCWKGQNCWSVPTQLPIANEIMNKTHSVTDSKPCPHNNVTA